MAGYAAAGKADYGAGGERPRERLERNGTLYLSDRELVCLLLGSGIRGKGVAALAEEVLAAVDAAGGVPSLAALSAIRGMGVAKASTVIAGLELGRRAFGAEGTAVKGPEEVHSLVRHYADRKQEQFICLSLNGAHEAIAVRVVSIGLVNRTVVHPREVFADPLTDRASAIVVAHNHPSGRLEPSPEDIEITERIRASGETLGIKLLDHLIFSGAGYYSFKEGGRL